MTRREAEATLSPTGVRPVPLHIITGFLGSGKTTLLRRLLATRGWERSAVLINEFGDDTFDPQSLPASASLPTVIDRGCVCCAMIEPLRRAIYNLFAEVKRGTRAPFDQILLETSGLSDPAPILSTLMTDRVLREYVAAGHVVTVIDALNAPRQMALHLEFQKQVATADLVVVTKEDMASRQAMSDLHRHVAALNPTARSVATGEPFELPRLLQSPTTFHFAERAPSPRPAQLAAAHGGARSFTLAYARPVDWSAFVVWLTMLLNRHGKSVLRVKGVLMSERPGPPLMIQGVQHVMHPPVHLRSWQGNERLSRIVFIVRGIEPAAVSQSLERFLAWADQGNCLDWSSQERPIGRKDRGRSNRPPR